MIVRLRDCFYFILFLSMTSHDAVEHQTRVVPLYVKAPRYTNHHNAVMYMIEFTYKSVYALLSLTPPFPLLVAAVAWLVGPAGHQPRILPKGYRPGSTSSC